jgi:hypothetical protein
MRGKPFEPGNKMGRGRPRGSRNKKNRFNELMQEHTESIITKHKVMAMSGDPKRLDWHMNYLERHSWCIDSTPLARGQDG